MEDLCVLNIGVKLGGAPAFLTLKIDAFIEDRYQLKLEDEGQICHENMFYIFLDNALWFQVKNYNLMKAITSLLVNYKMLIAPD